MRPAPPGGPRRQAIGLLYPALASYWAARGTDEKEQKRWLMYWVVYGIYMALSFVFDAVFGVYVPAGERARARGAGRRWRPTSAAPRPALRRHAASRIRAR